MRSSDWERLFSTGSFTSQEQSDCLREGRLTHSAAASLAARFAAKKPSPKPGKVGRQGVAWTDIEIKRAADGSPHIHLSGRALQVFDALNGCQPPSA